MNFILFWNRIILIICSFSKYKSYYSFRIASSYCYAFLFVRIKSICL